MKTKPFILGLALTGLPSCSGTDGLPTRGSSSNSSGSSQSAPVQSVLSAETIVIQAGAQTPVEVSTSPNAVCRFAHSASANDAPRHPIYADDDGRIRFNLATNGPAESAGQVALDCQTESGEARYTFNVETISHAVVPRPAKAPVVHPDRYVRPALLRPSALTQEELQKGGYPPRPDPSKAPELYSYWLRAVSEPATFIEPKTARLPAVFGGSGTPWNQRSWSGVVLFGSSYTSISGAWQVPSIISQLLPNDPLYAFQWVGFDGAGVPDVVQAGVFYDAEWILSGLCGSCYGSIDFYASWTLPSYEYFPDAPHGFTNFSVNVNDVVFVTVWPSDSSCNGANPSGGWGCFVIHNLSQNTYSQASIEAPPSLSTPFFGILADFIMEAPCASQACNSWYDLTNYGTVSMTGIAVDQNQNTHSISTDSFDLAQMVNNGHALSSATTFGSDGVSFTWHAPN